MRPKNFQGPSNICKGTLSINWTSQENGYATAHSKIWFWFVRIHEPQRMKISKEWAELEDLILRKAIALRLVCNHDRPLLLSEFELNFCPWSLLARAEFVVRYEADVARGWLTSTTLFWKLVLSFKYICNVEDNHHVKQAALLLTSLKLQIIKRKVFFASSRLWLTLSLRAWSTLSWLLKIVFAFPFALPSGELI